jgi:hypothetical protein
MSSKPDQISEMTGWSPSQLREWATGLDESRAPRDINWWLAMRWVAPQKHVYDRALAAEVRREWAEVFFLFVDCMERFTTYNRWSAADDRFNMRALLIREHGQVDGSATWNVDAFVCDVLAMLTLSPSQARELSREWQSLPRDQLLTLADHKSVLSPLGLVVDLLGSSPEADLAREWLALRPDLL